MYSLCDSFCFLRLSMCVYLIQVLQTFHKAKNYKGSPMQCESLQTVRGKESKIVYDPRPNHLRNRPESQHAFRSACLNYDHRLVNCLYL